MIAAIKADHYQMTPRHLLEVDVYHKAGKETYLALNEMRIDHGYTTQVIDVYIDDELLEVFRGNGLCVSTPSGSTAYNKSIGGAVIYPGSPLIEFIWELITYLIILMMLKKLKLEFLRK